MKHNIRIATALFAAVFFLQSASAQVRFGVKAGLNLASISYSDDFISVAESVLETDLSTGMVPSFHVGAQAEFDCGGPIGLSVGAQLSVKGGKLSGDGTALGQPFTFTSTASPMYLQVPVAVTFRKNGFYAGVGPYVGFGIGGKVKNKTEAAGQTDEESEDIKFGSSEDDDFASLDYGAGIELGYEFSNIRVSASYSLGLANIAPKDMVDQAKDQGMDISAKNNVIGVSVAYMFGNN